MLPPGVLPLLTVLLAAADPARAAAAPTPARRAVEREARAFLESFSALYLPVWRVANEAAWLAATDVTPDHAGQRAGARRAGEALVGSAAVIARTRALLAHERQLDPLTARQLRRLLLIAADSPGTLPQVVARRAELEARQARILTSFSGCLDPAPPMLRPEATASPPTADAPDGGVAAAPRPEPREPDIAAPPPCPRPLPAAPHDDILRRSTDASQRAQAWNAAQEVGRALRPGLQALIPLRNQIAREMGYPSFFALQVADYGMTVPELMALLDDVLDAITPLYEGLHCWARNRLAERFHQPVPRALPAHWIGTRWAQTWPGLVETPTIDAAFATRSAESIVRAAEAFYVSLGFPRLPETFWQRSDLFPVPAGSARRKDAQASTFAIDGERDVRVSMNVEPDQRWWGAAHHELAHVYYQLAYARPEVPFLLRDGPNRAFHEAIGELARLASLSPAYLQRTGLLRPGEPPDPAAGLLAAAMDALVFLPFAAGTITHFERDLYETPLPPAQWQARWWQYAARFQGLAAPSPRPAGLCDACTKSQLHDNPARYYDYALATLIKFQLHDHICRQILHQDVRACDYGGNPAVGGFLRKLMSAGATRDWRRLIRDTTGDDIGPRPLLEFFAPLNQELARRNQGKDCGR